MVSWHIIRHVDNFRLLCFRQQDYFIWDYMKYTLYLFYIRRFDFIKGTISPKTKIKVVWRKFVGGLEFSIKMFRYKVNQIHLTSHNFPILAGGHCPTDSGPGPRSDNRTPDVPTQAGAVCLSPQSNISLYHRSEGSPGPRTKNHAQLRAQVCYLWASNNFLGLSLLLHGRIFLSW